MPRSANARSLAAQGVPRSEIAKKLGITREAVRQAIGRKRPRPGRPPANRVRVVLRLPRTLYESARARQKNSTASLHTVLVDMLAEQLLSAPQLEAYRLERPKTARRKSSTA